MEIQKLIEVFKKLLPIYEKGYENNYNYQRLYAFYLNRGICYASIIITNKYLYLLFKKNGYYYNLIPKDRIFSYLFPEPKTGKDLKSRIDFMKFEIKSLNKLLKQGYTHV